MLISSITKWNKPIGDEIRIDKSTIVVDSRMEHSREPLLDSIGLDGAHAVESLAEMSIYGRLAGAVESFEFAAGGHVESLNEEVEANDGHNDRESNRSGHDHDDNGGHTVDCAVDEVFERDRYGRFDRGHVLAEAVQDASDGRRFEELHA